MWGLWERAGSSSPGGDLGVSAGACLGAALLECWAAAVSAAVRRRLSQRSGGGRAEGVGGDPAVLGAGGGACLCGETLPAEEKTVGWLNPPLDHVQQQEIKDHRCSWQQDQQAILGLRWNCGTTTHEPNLEVHNG